MPFLIFIMKIETLYEVILFKFMETKHFKEHDKLALRKLPSKINN